MDVPTQLELCLYDQTQIIANAAYIECAGGNFLARKLATYFLTFYCDPYFLFRFLQFLFAV